MKRDINPRETMAWIVLICAAFLFSVTVAFAQDNSSPGKGTTTIKIIKKEDGKTTTIDTTFNADDEAAVEKLMKDLGVEHTMSFKFPPKGENVGERYKRYMNPERTRNHENPGNETEELNEEMKSLGENMKDIHIEIFSDAEGMEGKEFSFNFEMPPMPADLDDSFFEEHCKGKMKHCFMVDNMSALMDDDHISITGDENEKPPVFEKEMTGENGEKIFVFKRSKADASIPGAESREDNTSMKLYPNPNGGKFSLSFHADQKSDLTIRIYNDLGKEVYTESKNDFSGDYTNRLDVSAKGKGNYILKITLGEKSMTEKFVVE